MAALFVISDQTLGASTIDDSEARLDVIDESVYKLVSFSSSQGIGAEVTSEMSEGRGSGVEGRSLAQARYYRGSVLSCAARPPGVGGRWVQGRPAGRPTAALSGASAAPADHQQSAAVRDFEHSLARVQPLLERYGYGAAFAAVMAEGMGVPTPGQTLLMAGALEAARDG